MGGQYDLVALGVKRLPLYLMTIASVSMYSPGGEKVKVIKRKRWRAEEVAKVAWILEISL